MCISRTIRFKYTFYQVTQMNHEYFFPSNHDLLLFFYVCISGGSAGASTLDAWLGQARSSFLYSRRLKVGRGTEGLAKTRIFRRYRLSLRISYRATKKISSVLIDVSP